MSYGIHLPPQAPDWVDMKISFKQISFLFYNLFITSFKISRDLRQN